MKRKNINKRHNRNRLKGNILSIITAFLLVSVCCVGFGSVISSAKDSDIAVSKNQMLYKSITIHENDTLWSIA